MSYAAEGVYTVYRETVRRARSLHRCAACRADIRPGDYYCDVFTLDEDSGADSLKRCGACQRTHEHLRGLCRERDDHWNSFWPDERLACGENYVDEWGDEPPDDVAALPLLSPDERGALLAPRNTHGGEPKGSARQG